MTLIPSPDGWWPAQEPRAAAPVTLADTAFPVEKSAYFQFHQAERGALAVHKWLLSEAAGRDVGEAFASWDWIIRGHRAQWLAAMRASGLAP